MCLTWFNITAGETICTNFLNLTHSKREAHITNSTHRFLPQLSCDYITACSDIVLCQMTNLSAMSPLPGRIVKEKRLPWTMASAN